MIPVKSLDLAPDIRRWDLVALAINYTIGGGIFGLPSKVFSVSGPASVLAYLICAAAVIPIVLCFAEVGSRFTRTGGPYVYAHAAFGPLVAFEVGWLRWLSGVASSAALANLFADYLSYFLPAAHTGAWRILTITAIVSVLTTVNVLGARDAAVVSNLLAVAKLLPLLLFVSAGLFFIHPHYFAAGPPPAYRTLSTSVLLLVYAFTGFESVGIPAGEVQEPRRNVPFALIVSIGATAVIYVLIHVVCVGTLPELATSSRPLADAGGRFLGPFGAWVITTGAVISIAGTIHGHILTTPRLLYAMASQGQLPPVFATVHERFRTPHISIAFSAIVILAAAISETFIQLAAISVITRVTIYLITCVALPVLRHKWNANKDTFTLGGGLAIPAVAVLVSGWLLSNCGRHEVWVAAIAASVGIILFGAYRGTNPPRHSSAESEKVLFN